MYSPCNYSRAVTSCVEQVICQSVTAVALFREQGSIPRDQM